MPTYHLGGKDIKVDAYQTWWPLSVIYKQQGLEVKVNPQRHWWCLWLCTTTDNIDGIEATAFLKGRLTGDIQLGDSCKRCSDLTLRSPASFGYSQPWLWGSVEYTGAVHINSQRYSFEGALVYT